MLYNDDVTKFIDLTGQRFGRLVVLACAPSPDYDSRFLARCDCSKEIVVRGRSLKSGNSTSCGCLRDQARARKGIDLTGSVFGRLSVVARYGSSPQGVLWSCRCSCGSETVVAGKTLRSGLSMSCGCANNEWRRRLQTEKFVGAKFGKLTVVGLAGVDGGKTFWDCLCDCGTSRKMRATDVNSGRVISCGCGVHTKEGLLSEKIRHQSAASCATRRARKLTAGGSYTPQQISDLYLKQQGRCANCGAPLGDKFHRDHRVSLAHGGTSDITNIELLCGPCNRKKSKKDELKWASENGRLL